MNNTGQKAGQSMSQGRRILEEDSPSGESADIRRSGREIPVPDDGLD